MAAGAGAGAERRAAGGSRQPAAGAALTGPGGHLAGGHLARVRGRLLAGFHPRPGVWSGAQNCPHFATAGVNAEKRGHKPARTGSLRSTPRHAGQTSREGWTKTGNSPACGTCLTPPTARCRPRHSPGRTRRRRTGGTPGHGQPAPAPAGRSGPGLGPPPRHRLAGRNCPHFAADGVKAEKRGHKPARRGSLRSTPRDTDHTDREEWTKTRRAQRRRRRPGLALRSPASRWWLGAGHLTPSRRRTSDHLPAPAT
jgi:hypothetical protein